MTPSLEARAHRRRRGRRVSATRASTGKARPNGASTSYRHISRAERAVAEYAPQLWQRVTPPLVRWLRRTLREVKPQLETLVIESRALSPETLYLQSLLEAYRFEDVPLERLEPIVADLTTRVSLEYGWLPDDPRTAEIERETRRLIEGDLFVFWRNLTSPETLAKRIVKLRQQGLSVEAMSGQLAAQYRANYYSAERIIRSTYTASANYAHTEDLKEQQYSHKKWITSRDSRVRAGGRSQYNHRQMEGQTVPIGEPFVTPEGHRLMYPGDTSLGAPAGTVVNCRCSVIGLGKG